MKKCALVASLALALALFWAPQVFAQATPVTCGQAANTIEGEPGTTFTIACPAGCTPGSIWGTGIYSDDSDMCTAAVHAGVLAQGAAGEVMVTVAPGQATYTATTQNGVTSSTWGEWGRSFTVSVPGAITCDTAANQLPGDPGTTHTVTCPAGCATGSVWGTAVYSDDSSICAAAIHAGAAPATGGEVTIQIAPGQAEYVSTAQNGVTSAAWGEWGRSFVFMQ